MKKIDRPFSPQALPDVLERRFGILLTSSFVVAYSGGRDSHVLLHAMHALGARVRAVHIDHGLQPSSREWSEHCARVCALLPVRCAIERIDVQPEGEESTEAAARRLRYQRLAAHVQSGEVLLTAHHQDDQAETVLLALVRGAGARGLAAMPAVTEFSAGRHARPLLDFSRAALAAYAASEKLSWVVDTSNLDQRMSRNFVRAQVLPLLEQRWPAAARALARAAANNADTVVLLDEIAQADLAQCADGDGASLLLPPLQRLPEMRQRNLVRYWIRHNGFDAPSAQHLEKILEQVSHPSRTGQACVDWPGVEVRRYRDQLRIQRRASQPDRELALPWRPPATLEIPNLGWSLRAVAAHGEGLSRARTENAALTVRLRKGGEVCQLAGREHHHQLKKLLQEAGVPPWERERLPLIFAGDELAAIGDRWVCAPFAAHVDEPGWRIVLESSK